MRYALGRRPRHYNRHRPDSNPGYVTPTSFAELRRQAGCIGLHTPVPDGYRSAEVSGKHRTCENGAGRLSEKDLRGRGRLRPLFLLTSDYHTVNLLNAAAICGDEVGIA